uniref:Uncharacterized protein n=1 Tax=Strigamia maritima TaxID=126957 RepID=T1JGA9_STRMM
MYRTEDLVTVRNAAGIPLKKQNLKKLAEKPARYILPNAGEIDLMFDPTRRPVTLPPLQDSSGISNRDKLLNEEMMAKLISNQYQREILKDMAD